jgi:hypothetical protein
VSNQERHKQWQHLSDSRKRCSCRYWACGVFDSEKGFERRSIGETTLERAKAVLRLRVKTGSRTATLPDHGTRIKDAVEDFMAYTADGGARESTLRKYQTLLDQLQAYADWNGLHYVHELNQDAVLEFRRAWEIEDAGYKRSAVNENQTPLALVGYWHLSPLAVNG